MTDCESHLRAGLAVHMLLVAATTVGYAAGGVPLGTVATVAVALPLTLAGAVFPDLDHHASLPYRCGQRVLPPLLGLVVVLVGFRYREAIMTALFGAPSGGLPGFLSGTVVASLGWGTWVAAYTLFPVLRPPHRTVTHCVATGVVVALCVGAVASLLVGDHGTLAADERLLMLASSGSFLVGFLSHIGLDGPLSR
jgi:hypothetical protein